MTQINAVLTSEAPITKPLLYRRILAAWGIGRAGSRIVAHLDSIIENMGVRQTQHGRQSILWHREQDPRFYECYRIAREEADKRDVEDLPLEEIAIALKEILKRQLSLPRTELIRECARLFGYARIGSKVEEVIGLGVDHAIESGLIELQNARLVYSEG